jgi:putative salt-induced outer membrane protein YdiY
MATVLRMCWFSGVCWAMWGAMLTPAAAQQWLTDQSFRPSAPLQPLQQPPLPAVPSEGLFEPPPPLEPQMPPAVFEEVAAAQSAPAGPVWYYPWTWIPMDGWENSAELGLNGSAGNAESFSFQTGSRFKRKSDFTLFDLRATYNRTTANGLETQNNALVYSNWERFLGDSPWTYFVNNGLEFDRFRAFDVRYNINSGLGYNFIKTEELTLAGRFGAGASREYGGPDDRWVPEALFGGDYEHQINARNKLIAKLEYFPEWGDFSNFRLVSDVAWEYLIDAKGNLSFKLGALDRYDSTPNGAKPNDVNYSALLLYKF